MKRIGFFIALALLCVRCSNDDDNTTTVAETSLSIVQGVTTISQGTTLPLTAELSPNNATNTTIVWSSDNTIVATVDENGLVQALQPGTATITATLQEDDSIFGELVITVNDGAFITTWENTMEVTIPMNSAFTYDYQVDWGDGTTEQVTNDNATSGTNNTLTFSHLFTDQGPHTVSITGQFPAIRFSNVPGTVQETITQVNQWGSIAWESMGSAFSGCKNVTFPATDVPNLDGVTDMTEMFLSADAANPDVSQWNVSKVTNMEGMFFNTDAANPDVSQWNVSKVTNMANMFEETTVANPDVTNWNVDEVTNISNMFSFAKAANPDVSQWNIPNVTDMDSMFDNSALSSDNYTAALLNFARQTTPDNVSLDTPDTQFCTNQGAEAAKETLSSRGWAITDGGATTCTTL